MSLRWRCSWSVRGSGVRRKQRRDLAAGTRVEVALGDEGDDFMALVAPSERGRRVCERDGEQKPGEEKRL